MKITIVGPGAIGCLLAAFLSKGKESGQQVWILDKNNERALKINQQGINVEGISGNWQVPIRATTEVKEIEKTDLLIICVKSYDTKSAITLAKPLITDKTLVLTLQNGIGNIEVISEVAGIEKVIAGITNMGATLLDFGHLRHAGKGETIIGKVDTKIPTEIHLIQEIFNKADIETRITTDIKSFLWSKLLVNVGINALTAITRLNNGKLLDYEGTRKIMRMAVEEGIEVVMQKKIKLTYNNPLSKVEEVCRATSGNVSSMLQDVLKKRRTEIDFINGVIVRQAQELGIQAPINSLLLDLVKTIEASYNLTVER